MKAIVQERFGPPDVLQLVDADLSEVSAGEVLVRVHAAALNPYDWHIMRGDPLIARLMGEVGLTKPKARVAGVDAAGGWSRPARTCAGCGPATRARLLAGRVRRVRGAEADKVVPSR